MTEMQINPDAPLWQWGFVVINRTLIFTWIVMGLLTLGSWLVTRRLSSGTELSRGQNLLEVLVETLRQQIRDVSRQDPGPYLPFVGTLFACVFVAVPVYGITSSGLVAYLKQYLQPSVFMLPFNIIGELSRTLALAVRLYGNIMSGSVIGAILLAFVPLFVPVLMQMLGLLTGMIQAYIFAVLAMVYIASAAKAHEAITRRQADRRTAA